MAHLIPFIDFHLLALLFFRINIFNMACPSRGHIPPLVGVVASVNPPFLRVMFEVVIAFPVTESLIATNKLLAVFGP